VEFGLTPGYIRLLQYNQDITCSQATAYRLETSSRCALREQKKRNRE
jgi:hypothetical protein